MIDNPRFDTSTIYEKRDGGKTATAPQESLFSLLTSLWASLNTWVEQEFALAKSEVSEKANLLGHHILVAISAVVMLVAGGLLAILAVAAGVIVLLQHAGLPSSLALVVGFIMTSLVILLAGTLQLRRAKKGLTTQNLTPRRTVETLKKSADWAQQKIK